MHLEPGATVLYGAVAEGGSVLFKGGWEKDYTASFLFGHIRQCPCKSMHFQTCCLQTISRCRLKI